MPASTAPAEPSRPGRAELLWLAGAILIGMILRLSYPGRMAIEHFDEGVYASNFWFGAEEGYEYPARYLYAPPLLPAAIEWTMIFASMFGVRPTGFIPMIPSLIAGLATIPSIWWVGRRWFGPSSGVVSAWLVAASDFHTSYSRAALTDVPVCLFILWGTYFTWQALQKGTRRSIGLAALFTALAWWTKYNGWLPLAIGISGGVAWQLTLPRANRKLAEFAKRWVVVAGLSFLLWSPVLIGLQQHGGYAAVAANHRQYVEGFAKWPANAAEQLDHVADYDGPLRPIWKSLSATRLGSSVLLGIPKQVGWAPILLLLLSAITSCLISVVRNLHLPTEGSAWALLAWLCGMTLATPFYHPYPRLVMPWMIAAWLGAGVIVQVAIDSGKIFGLRPQPNGKFWRIQWLDVCIATWLLFGVACYSWEDRSMLAQEIAKFADEIRDITSSEGFPGDEAIAFVYGAPEIVFHLSANGIPLAFPTQSERVGAEPRAHPTFSIRSVSYKPFFQYSGSGHVKRVLIESSSLVSQDNRGMSRRVLILKRVRN